MPIPQRVITTAEEPEQALVAPNGAMLFERLAGNPDISVEKIERLMALWERSEARKAETAFNVAMAFAQAEMKAVAKDANNPQTHSKYASYQALDNALRPIYTKWGFALTFNTDTAPQAEHVRILCKTMHKEGHAELYHIDMPADGKGAKGGDVMTKTHATGSAVSYGMRYLLKMIFNVATGEHDDDGNGAARREEVRLPAGFEKWADDMQAAADSGMDALGKAWTASQPEFRRAAGQARLNEWKARAKKAGGNHAA